jgi:cytochrome c biogenesis protein CcdA/thiol-disulfide isomerase/thioredoxin
VTLLVLSYLAGVLTILAPCILPVLPFVFSRADRPFLRNGLPLLGGLVLGFVTVALLATVAAAWAGTVNDAARVIALVGLATTGLTLLAPRLASIAYAPLAALGARLDERAQSAERESGPSVLLSVLVGLATGLLWAPCAGPILGLVLSTAVLQGPGAGATLLFAAYAAGAATSLALACLVGGRVLKAMKRLAGPGEWARRGLGALVLAGVAVISLGLDNTLFAALPALRTDGLEQSLLQRWIHKPTTGARDATPRARLQTVGLPAPSAALPVEGQLPDFTGATAWINSEPLTAAQLRGKVVLLDVWTFDCINCRNALPYVRAWAEKYKDQGLVVIGVHSPEFAYERKLENVRRAVRDLGLSFPIAVDNNFAIWRALDNRYWPAHYFVDAQGRIRFHKFGEGDYERSEQVIRQLLDEARTALGSI